MMSEYEKQRAENIAKNKEILKELGLEAPMFEPSRRPQKPRASKKRKTPPPADDEDFDEPAVKVSKTISVASTTENGLRRSSRNSGKQVDYNNVQPLVIKTISRTNARSNEGPLGREAGSKRIHDPKVFGHIPGVKVGTWWESREACSADAIHAPWVGGISGGPNGAYSVALSGGYDDDVDWGYGFTYTGSGGRDLKGTKAAPKNLRTAPQSCDQSWENGFNKMLKRSVETQKPVRVIRGFKLPSPYAPEEGYRYDGLYIVKKAWMEKGLNPGGFLVCKFIFKRIEGQPDLPTGAGTSEDEEVPGEEDASEESEDQSP